MKKIINLSIHVDNYTVQATQCWGREHYNYVILDGESVLQTGHGLTRLIDSGVLEDIFRDWERYERAEYEKLKAAQ